MSEKVKKITTPNRYEIIARFSGDQNIDFNDPVIERFCTIIAYNIAEQELDAIGVIMKFIMEIVKFLSAGSYPGSLIGLLYSLIPHMVEALVDDEEAREEALCFYHSYINASF